MQSLAILGLLDGVVSGHGFLGWAPETTPEKPGDSSVHLRKDKERAGSRHVLFKSYWEVCLGC